MSGSARRYVAFLRAINVGGRIVKMAALRKIFEHLKLGEVETFIASGNVVFTSSSDAARLEGYDAGQPADVVEASRALRTQRCRAVPG